MIDGDGFIPGTEFRNRRNALQLSRERIAADLGLCYDTIKNYDRDGAPQGVRYYLKCKEMGW